MSCGPEKVSPKKLYKILIDKKRDIEKQSPISIYQKDFSEGTYLIDKPGYYVLRENIVFNPNPNNDYLPRKDQLKYITLGFSLGFFAVVAIYAKDVYLNLNGFTIAASPEFTLQQRFFSIIELANGPFLSGEGPSNFATPEGFKFAENTIVGNGTLSLSSHHGIHGNMANNILLEKMKISQFEFVGIALNGGHCIILKDIDIGPNRIIPVLATYSAARFAKMFATHIIDKNILTENEKGELLNNLNLLQNEMTETFNEVMKKKTVSSDLFRNDTGLPDGNIYGVLIKNVGFAVNDFVDDKQLIKEKKIKTSNVFLYNVNVKDMKCRVDEVIALSTKGGLGLIVDVAGAVLQIDKINEDGKYRGTNLSNLQLNLAKIAFEKKIPLGKNNISKDILDWSKGDFNLDNLLKKGYKYKCGSDSMGHYGKGISTFRFDALSNVLLKKCSLSNISNEGRLGNDKLAGNYEKSSDVAKRNGYFGASTTGVNISCCSNVKLYKCEFNNIESKNGDATGINIIFKSDVEIDKCKINDITAGTYSNKKWRAIDYYGDKVKCKDLKPPNKNPIAVGIKVEKDCLVNIDDTHIHKLTSFSKPVKILKE